MRLLHVRMWPPHELIPPSKDGKVATEVLPRPSRSRWPLPSACEVANAGNLGLVILDACRNNPFGVKIQRTIHTRAVDRGLARTEPTDNVLVAYAAKDGTTANDGSGRNSPFSAALLSNLETPGLEITFILRNIRDDVMAATKREQQPFVYGSLSKEAIYLKAGPSVPTHIGEAIRPLLRRHRMKFFGAPSRIRRSRPCSRNS